MSGFSIDVTCPKCGQEIKAQLSPSQWDWLIQTCRDEVEKQVAEALPEKGADE